MIYLITVGIFGVLFLLLWLFGAFALTISSIWFWVALWFCGVLAFAISFLIGAATDMKSFDEDSYGLIWRIFGFGLPALIVLSFVIDLFCFKNLARIAPEIEKVAIEDMFPTTDTIENDAIVDTKTAEKNANKVLGTLGTIGSRYIAKEYFVITMKEPEQEERVMMRVAPLGYDGFWRYWKYKNDGIPGYIKSKTTETGSALYIPLDKAIFYSPSACFGKDLHRHIRFAYPTLLIGDSHFEIDDEGNGQWITPYYNHRILFGGNEVVGTIVTDANTGQSRAYRLGEEPEWVSCVYAGDYVCDIYSWQGKYFNGLANALFGKEGCWKTTEVGTDSSARDYAYKYKDGVIWSVTGVKTLASDTHSTIAVLMVNQKTNKAFWCDMAGADEDAVMTTASEEYHAYEYAASFPSLINIDGELTYVCVVTDKESVVKNWVFINMKDISKIVTAKSEKEGFSKYRQLLKLGDTVNTDDATDSDITVVNEAIGSIDAVRLYTKDGVTYVEIDKDGKTEVYKVEQ